VGHHQVETRILEKSYTLQCGLYIKNGGMRSFYNGWGGVHLCICNVESALVMNLFVMSSVGSLTCRLKLSSEVALPVELVEFFNNLKIQLCYDCLICTYFLPVSDHTTGMMSPKIVTVVLIKIQVL
jgi:hypothetical protein